MRIMVSLECIWEKQKFVNYHQSESAFGLVALLMLYICVTDIEYKAEVKSKSFWNKGLMRVLGVSIK